uniref:Traf-like protein n=1 Tax=Tetraselmis sp. GSL018 TaxID=582737 RepID=A0A061RFS9_9CHLO
MQQLVASTIPSQLFGGAPPPFPQPMMMPPGRPPAHGKAATGKPAQAERHNPPAAMGMPPACPGLHPHQQPASSGVPAGGHCHGFPVPSALPQQLGYPSAAPPMSGGGLSFGGLLSCWDLAGNTLLPLVTTDDLATALGLADALMASRSPRARPMASTLYSMMFRLFGDQGCRERMLMSLISRAADLPQGMAALKSGEGASSGARDARTPARGKGKAATAAAAAAAARSPEKPSTGVAAEIFLGLVEEQSGCARAGAEMLLRTIGDLLADRSRLEARVQSLSDELQARSRDAESLRSSADEAKDDAQKRVKAVEDSMSRLKGERAADAERFAEERRDLESRVREAESQAEWARGEREELSQRFAQEKKDLAQRLKDSEQQVARLKNSKRDEVKKASKEKTALSERVKELEAAQRRYEQEIRRLSEEKARVGKEAERAATLQGACAKAEKLVASKDDQLVAAKSYIDSLEAKLGALQGYTTNLETNLKEEMTRHAPLYGANLDSLREPELETLMQIHEEGVKRVRNILAIRKHNSNPGGARPHIGGSIVPGPSITISSSGSFGSLHSAAAAPRAPSPVGPIGVGRVPRGGSDTIATAGAIGERRGAPGSDAASSNPAASSFLTPFGREAASAAQASQAPAVQLLPNSTTFRNNFQGLGTGFPPTSSTSGLPNGSNFW